MARPSVADYNPYFEKYIQRVQADNILEAIDHYSEPLSAFFSNLPEGKANYRYADNKWTVKELLQHVTDTERIMSYRLLRISRKDKTPLASFDENTFAANSGAADRSFDSIKEEFLAVRKASDLLLKSLTAEQLKADGIASNHRATANAIAYIIFGHMLHHKHILEERYL